MLSGLHGAQNLNEHYSRDSLFPIAYMRGESVTEASWSCLMTLHMHEDKENTRVGNEMHVIR